MALCFLGFLVRIAKGTGELLGVIRCALHLLTGVITDSAPLTHMSISGHERFLVTSAHLGAIFCNSLLQTPENGRYFCYKPLKMADILLQAAKKLKNSVNCIS